MSKRVQRKKEDNTAANVNLVTKGLLFFYLVVGLSPKVVEIEYEGFQWFYFSALNVISLLFIFMQRKYLKPFQIDKKAKQFFLIFLALLVVSIASITQSINVSESVVHLLRLLNIVTAGYIFYILFRNNPKSIFNFIAKVCALLLLYHSLVTMQHFMGNYTKPRTVSLYKSFLHYFGNINFFTAGLIIKIPFAIYLILKGKTLWKFISYIAVLTSILSLMFSGSRTAMLSLTAIIVIMILYSVLTLKENKKEKFFQLGYFILVPFLAFFIFSNTNKIDKKEANSFSDIFEFSKNNFKETNLLKSKDAKNFTTDVVIKNEDDLFTRLIKKSGRGQIWPAAISAFLNNPVLGVGYGNYKVHPKPNYFKNKISQGNYSISIRAHNDFLEKFVETGAIGGLLYIAIFIFIVILMFKLFNQKYQKEIILVLFLSGIAFTIDSFFNFPAERIPIYLFFILIVALILAINGHKNLSEIEEDIEETEKQKIAFYLFITVLLVGSGLNYMVYKSYTENTIFKNQAEFKRRKYNLTYEGFKNRVTSFPDLDQDAIKMGYYSASYASLESKWKEVMNELKENIDEQETAQNYILKKLKAEVFLKAYKNIDSAEFYYRENFEKFPAYKQNYSMLKNIYIGKKENDKLEALMHSYTNQNYTDAKEWVYKANYFYKKTKDPSLGLKILDTGLAYVKDNIDIVKAKEQLSKHKTVNNYYKTDKTRTKYTKAIELYNKQKYKEAVAIFYKLVKENPNDFYAIQYIGITEMNLKNYKTAEKYLTKTIESKIFKDGKAEFCRGFCYERLGKKELSKKDYRVSRERKFVNAMSLAKSKYE